MRRSSLNDEAGFTVAELAVGLMLSALVLLAAYAAYAGFARVSARWAERRSFEADVHLFQRRVADDTRAASQVEAVGRDQVRFQTRRGPVVYTESSPGRWTRSGMPVLRDTSARLRLAWTPEPPMLRLEGVAVLRRDTLSVHVAVAMRYAPLRAWEPQP